MTGQPQQSAEHHPAHGRQPEAGHASISSRYANFPKLWTILNITGEYTSGSMYSSGKITAYAVIPAVCIPFTIPRENSGFIILRGPPVKLTSCHPAPQRRMHHLKVPDQSNPHSGSSPSVCSTNCSFCPSHSTLTVMTACPRFNEPLLEPYMCRDSILTGPSIDCLELWPSASNP